MEPGGGQIRAGHRIVQNPGGGDRRQRELFPVPLPFAPEAVWPGPSRSVRRRLLRKRPNLYFKDPDYTSLPTGSAWGTLELQPEADLHVGAGNVANAVHCMGIPGDLGDMFTLPHISAQSLGLTELDGVPLLPHESLTPQLTVLPMGWSWSVFFCQRVMEHAVSQAGLGEGSRVRDRKPALQVVLPPEDGVSRPPFTHVVVHGEYVDNFLVLGSRSDVVDLFVDRIAAQLRAWGL